MGLPGCPLYVQRLHVCIASAEARSMDCISIDCMDVLQLQGLHVYASFAEASWRFSFVLPWQEARLADDFCSLVVGLFFRLWQGSLYYDAPICAAQAGWCRQGGAMLRQSCDSLCCESKHNL